MRRSPPPPDLRLSLREILPGSACKVSDVGVQDLTPLPVFGVQEYQSTDARKEVYL